MKTRWFNWEKKERKWKQLPVRQKMRTTILLQTIIYKNPFTLLCWEIARFKENGKAWEQDHSCQDGGYVWTLCFLWLESFSVHAEASTYIHIVIYIYIFLRLQVLVGDMGTGKTSLVLRFIKGQFFDHQVSIYLFKMFCAFISDECMIWMK